MDYVIIVAGGKGLRMGTDLPKQFLEINGLPILMHTIRQFRAYSDDLQIILVLPKNQQDFWMELCEKHHFNEPLQIADGGETRFHSVKNGLSLIPDDADGIVGVHDGVRPFVSIEVIRRCYAEAKIHEAVVPVIPIVETIWYAEKDSNPTTVDRNLYHLGQTPQTFSIQLLKKAFLQDYRDSFTDDASVVKEMGMPITLIEGNPENIKITTPNDLKTANKKHI